jgi:membrane protein implicated in regulation of membrane protease activity
MNAIYTWLLLTAALLVIEALTAGLTTIWFAGGSVVALILAFLGAPL